MTDCPYCDEWRYDQYAAPFVARPVNGVLPVVYDGKELREARMSEAPFGPALSLGRHICEEHWLEPDVIRLGPLRLMPI